MSYAIKVIFSNHRNVYSLKKKYLPNSTAVRFIRKVDYCKKDKKWGKQYECESVSEGDPHKSPDLMSAAGGHSLPVCLP